jgi:hypothetical protein
LVAVSEDEHISGYIERKGALRHQVAEAGEEALMLFAADKNYKHCLELLRELLPESPLVDELDAELAWH